VFILHHLDNMDNSKLDEIKEQEKLYRNRIMNELLVLKSLDHQNILRITPTDNLFGSSHSSMTNIVKLYEYFEDGGKENFNLV